jgi:hypothetical protein
MGSGWQKWFSERVILEHEQFALSPDPRPMRIGAADLGFDAVPSEFGFSPFYRFVKMKLIDLEQLYAPSPRGIMKIVSCPHVPEGTGYLFHGEISCALCECEKEKSMAGLKYMCNACQKEVVPSEHVNVGGKIFHNQCAHMGHLWAIIDKVMPGHPGAIAFDNLHKRISELVRTEAVASTAMKLSDENEGLRAEVDNLKARIEGQVTDEQKTLVLKAYVGVIEAALSEGSSVAGAVAHADEVLERMSDTFFRSEPLEVEPPASLREQLDDRQTAEALAEHINAHHSLGPFVAAEKVDEHTIQLRNHVQVFGVDERYTVPTPEGKFHNLDEMMKAGFLPTGEAAKNVKRLLDEALEKMNKERGSVEFRWIDSNFEPREALGRGIESMPEKRSDNSVSHLEEDLLADDATPEDYERLK